MAERTGTPGKKGTGSAKASPNKGRKLSPAAEEQLIRFGKRVRELREALGLTQSPLAEAAKVSQQQIVDYEHGRKQPGFEALCGLADVLDTSTDYLLGRTDDSDPPGKKGELLTDDERRLLMSFRGMDSEPRGALLTLLRSFSKE